MTELPPIKNASISSAEHKDVSMATKVAAAQPSPTRPLSSAQQMTPDEFRASIAATIASANATLERSKRTCEEAKERVGAAVSSLDESMAKFNNGFRDLMGALAKSMKRMGRTTLTAEEMMLPPERQRQLELEEKVDSIPVLKEKVDKLVEYIRQSSNFVMWTGAGISTNAGVSDYRGPEGKWTCMAEKRVSKLAGSYQRPNSVQPSFCHRAILALQEEGLLQNVISTNTDGLHLRSGLDPLRIVELHGNSNKLRCNLCKEVCFVDGRVRVAKEAKKHETAFKCEAEGCPGTLCDTIINFGEHLHEEVQQRANRFGSEADLLLVMGSSLRVITCTALEEVEQRKGGKIVIVNKQRTPYDDVAALRIFADTDVVMNLVMEKLSLQVPDQTLKRFVDISFEAKPCTTPVVGGSFAQPEVMNSKKGTEAPKPPQRRKSSIFQRLPPSSTAKRGGDQNSVESPSATSSCNRCGKDKPLTTKVVPPQQLEKQSFSFSNISVIGKTVDGKIHSYLKAVSVWGVPAASVVEAQVHRTILRSKQAKEKEIESGVRSCVLSEKEVDTSLLELIEKKEISSTPPLDQLKPFVACSVVESSVLVLQFQFISERSGEPSTLWIAMQPVAFSSSLSKTSEGSKVEVTKKSKKEGTTACTMMLPLALENCGTDRAAWKIGGEGSKKGQILTPA